MFEDAPETEQALRELRKDAYDIWCDPEVVLDMLRCSFVNNIERELRDREIGRKVFAAKLNMSIDEINAILEEEDSDGLTLDVMVKMACTLGLRMAIETKRKERQERKT